MPPSDGVRGTLELNGDLRTLTVEQLTSGPDGVRRHLTPFTLRPDGVRRHLKPSCATRAGEGDWGAGALAAATAARAHRAQPVAVKDLIDA